MSFKVDYVLKESRKKHTRHHECHWPGCKRQVAPAMWGCKPHWNKLPLDIRSAIWRSYRPGQEIKRTPSSEYILAAQRAQQWIRQLEVK